METTGRRGSPEWLAPTLLWMTAVGAAVAVGVWARSQPDMLVGPGGRGFPRVPGPPPDLPTLLNRIGVGSVVWYAGAVAFPFMLLGARRLDTERHGRLRTVGVSFAVVALLVAGTSAADYFVTFRGAPSRPRPASYFTVALRQDLLPWIALAGIVAAIEWRRRALRSMLERERLRAQVAEQRLIALTGQLHPHFLFNTLQGISTLIHRDANAADEMLAKLSDLLRDLLRHRDRVLVPLGDEVRYTRTYLEIAELRFADRLTFEVDAPADLLHASVPLFILQPLVENALAHGIGARMRGGHVAVRVSRLGGRLQLEVSDDGAGLPASGALHDGIGLGNTRERLRASFGADQHLSLDPRQGGGAVVRIDIPYRVHQSPPEPA